MRIVVAAPQKLWEELTLTLPHNECVRVNGAADFDEYTANNVFINLFEGSEKLTYRNDGAVILINSIENTLTEYNHHRYVYRINGWNGFLSRDKWEIAGHENAEVTKLFEVIQKKFQWTKDIPGFISCRIISMIVNEAYHTLEQGVSTKEEIDIAMKLGTNYPKGPFEWSEEIGLEKIHALLAKLSKEDARYTPASRLVKETALS